ncbi:chaperone protein EcpD [Providencia alcalifaciens]|nr:chaperone protein EcpD [Providencia alcalifaciens]
MKFIILLLCCIASFTASANNIILNGTRFIYPGNDKEITVQLSNTADRPALVQAWLDNGDPAATPDTISTPFIITPPISRVDGKSGQTLRIKLANSASLAKNRESVWWLNILEIPPVAVDSRDEGKNILQLAIRSRFKFFYRPVGLGDRDRAAEKLSLTGQGNNLIINNPSPFYLTVSNILRNGKNINPKTTMIAPNASETIPLTSAVNRGETLTVLSINDYGTGIPVKLAVN